MATPIKETPILKGKDAQRFVMQARLNEWLRERDDIMKRMRENYEKINSLIPASAPRKLN